VKRKTLKGTVIGKIERVKSVICSKVEYPFGIIKEVFGYVGVRFKGIGRNAKAVYMQS
jgi:hypothetical protein